MNQDVERIEKLISDIKFNGPNYNEKSVIDLTIKLEILKILNSIDVSLSNIAEELHGIRKRT
jgi:hypothetical protein